MNDTAMNDAALLKALTECKTLAVVGLSADPSRPSNAVAKYMLARGYRIIPVNPKEKEILGQKCYPALADIPEKVDMVDVFRRSEDCPGIAKESVGIGAKYLWLQLGVISGEAQKIAEEGGLKVVMDRCLELEYARLIEGKAH